MVTKNIYQIFIQRIYKPPTSQKKFSDTFAIEEENWKYIYKLPFMCCQEIKLQMFQYKMNLNVLMTKSRLFKMNLVNDDLCSLCNNNVETVKHLFYDCNKVKHIWTEFCEWWKDICGEQIELDYKSIVLGENPCNPDLILNLCIIIIKRMIYVSKFGYLNINLHCFKQMLKFQYDIEKQISLENCTEYKHRKKWSVFIDKL